MDNKEPIITTFYRIGEPGSEWFSGTNFAARCSSNRLVKMSTQQLYEDLRDLKILRYSQIGKVLDCNVPYPKYRGQIRNYKEYRMGNFYFPPYFHRSFVDKYSKIIGESLKVQDKKKRYAIHMNAMKNIKVFDHIDSED